MEWESYIQGILSEKDALDELSVSIDGGDTHTEFPSLIRASVRILDRILDDNGRLNIFVFPEKQQMLFLFMIAKVIHNLTGGKISHTYDPSQFKTGEKVKLGKAILEYQGITQNDAGQKCIKFRTSDVIITAPIEYLPVLQHVKTNQKLSKHDKYIEEKNKIKASLKQFGSDSILLDLVSHKSHLDKSIVYVSSVSVAKERLNECLLDNQKIQDILLLGQTSFDGVIRNISAGQLDGKPALVLASDLYNANVTASQGCPLQSMIIDITNINQANTKLDQLDIAIALKIPLLCITDAPDAFDLEEFRKRGFKVWRWDSVSLTGEMMAGETFLDKRLRNCKNHSIHYCNISDPVLSECMMRLSRQKHNIADQSSDIIRLYDQLVDLTFRALRETKRFGHRQTEEAERAYSNCVDLRLSESSFVTDDMANDLIFAATTLKNIYNNLAPLPKNQAMKEWFAENADGRKICIVVPENENRQNTRNYWNTVCQTTGKKCEIGVYFPTEYCNTRLVRFDTTILIGWMRRDVMRKVIFSYATMNYELFLYECERRWKNNEERNWARAVSSSDNQEIIKKTLSRSGNSISVTKWETDQRYVADGEADDLSELEQTLKDNKFRQYTRGTEGVRAEKVLAVPVSFVGGYVSFYRLEHKVVQVTNILNGLSEKVRILTPDRLEEGDFVIVREADQDLIREIADEILQKQGKSELRETAGKWRDTLKIELLFSTEQEVYNRLKKAGCQKNFFTFINWVNDEDMIAPQDKEDIRIIAEACKNETLMELLDQVYDAAKEVRVAHTQAGMQLSRMLREEIAQELKSQTITDIYNIWAPIQMEVEGIGTVKILKIIDIDKETPMEIEISMTNRLLSE